MRIDIITLFPEIALAPLNESIIKRAQAAGTVAIIECKIDEEALATGATLSAVRAATMKN